MAAPNYVIRLHLNAHLGVEAASLTAYVDETETYRVDPIYGPFDSWTEVLDRLAAALDRQMTLW